MIEHTNTVQTSPEDALRQVALRAVNKEMGDRLGIPPEDITERRKNIQSMSGMLRQIQDGGTIFGEGFYVKREPRCFTVFRKAAGIQHVAPRAVTGSTMLAPKMPFERNLSNRRQVQHSAKPAMPWIT